MTTTRLGHAFTIDGVSFEKKFDTFLNIQKRRETVDYKTISSVNNLNLAFAQGTTINSDNNVSINDRSDTLPENRSTSRETDQNLTAVNGFNIETEQFLVTDVYTDAVGNQPLLPLFYQHQIDRTLGATQSYTEIQVLDSNFSPVTLLEIKTDLSNGIVYNNLANTFNETSGIAELFYVSYVIKESVTGVLTRFTELVSNQPVFRTATFSDLDEFGNFLPGVKVYIIQEDIGATFNVRLPSTTNYSIRRLQDQRLRVVNPPSSTTDDPWFVSVQNSNFISSVDVGLGTDSIFKYRIAEFAVQNFTPFIPFKLTTESSSRVNRRTVKTIQDKIVQDTDEGLYVDVFVYDSEETLRFALSSDPAKVGQATAFTGVNYANVLLGDSAVAGTNINDSGSPVAGSSIDSLYGFIVLPAGFEIEETDIINTSYYYEEDKYEISFINLNPLTDIDLVKERIVLFVRPEPLGSTLTQTLFYLIVNEDGIVIESNYNADGVQSSLYDGLEVQTAIEAGQLWYDRDPSAVSWAPAGSVDFVDSYTVQGTPNQQSFLILGEVYVRENTQPNSINLNDIRIRGGGFDEAEQTEIETIQPEAVWNWDVGMWDGYPYPGAASFFVDLPVDILEDCGGLFSPGSARGIVERHVGYGIYPVLHKYNDYEPTITGINVSVSGTYVGWTEHPEDAVFDVYSSPFEQGPWTQTVTGLRQELDQNLIFLSIPENVTRYIIVTGRQDSDGPVCFSGPLDVEDPGSDVEPTTISGYIATPLTHNFNVL